MAFDDKKFNAPATNGDLGGVAITASLSLSYIAFALEAVDRDDKDDLKKRIALIRKCADDLDEMFTTLTGYSSSDG